GAAAAGGASGSGAAGAAGAGNTGTPRDPGLITHDGASGGYDYYANSYGDFDRDPYEPRGGQPGRNAGGGGDEPPGQGPRGARSSGAGDPEPDGSDGRMTPQQARRRRTWRRVRRSCYVAVAVMILLPMAVFAYGYMNWKT